MQAHPYFIKLSKLTSGKKQALKKDLNYFLK